MPRPVSRRDPPANFGAAGLGALLQDGGYDPHLDPVAARRTKRFGVSPSAAPEPEIESDGHRARAKRKQQLPDEPLGRHPGELAIKRDHVSHFDTEFAQQTEFFLERRQHPDAFRIRAQHDPRMGLEGHHRRPQSPHAAEANGFPNDLRVSPVHAVKEADRQRQLVVAVRRTP